jgi:lipopolysaccharide exporter
MNIIKNIQGNYWARAGILNLIQNFGSVAFGFGSFYFLIRMLSKHEWGVWVLFLATIAVFAMARNGMLMTATIKFIAGAKSEEEKRQLIATTLSMNLIMTAILIAILAAIAPLLSWIWESPELTPMLWLFGFSFIFSSLQMHFNSIEQAYLNFKGSVFTQLTYNGLFFLVVLYYFLSNRDIVLIDLIYANLFANILATFPSLYYIRKRIEFKLFVNKDWAKRVFHFGKYSMGTSMNAILSDTIDQMMIGAMISASNTGVFNVASRISTLANIPVNAMASILFPQGAKRLEEEGPHALKYLYEKSVGTLMAIMVPAVIFLFATSHYLIDFIAGDKYEDSLPLLKITLFYCLFMPFSRQMGTILDSIGKTRLNFIMVFSSGICNVILNYIFISHWGVLGAAFATLTTYILFFIGSQIILRNMLKVDLLNVWKFSLLFYPEMYQKFLKKKVEE